MKIISQYITLFAVVLCCFAACQNDEKKSSRHMSKEKLIELNTILVRMDSMYITMYSDTMNLNSHPTPSGLWLTIHDEGNGDLIETGQTVDIAFKISNLKGKTYYTSETDGSRQIVVGKGDIEDGLNETLQMLRPHARATAILIPDKAFGLLGDNNKIRGRQILRYDIEILNVK